MTEDQLQSACFIWAWNTHPQTRRCMWAIPNGGSRNKAEAAKFKATGVLAGVLDMHFFWKGKLFLFEFKVGRNQLSQPQKDFYSAVGAQGAIYWVVRDSPDSFKKYFENILNGVYE